MKRSPNSLKPNGQNFEAKDSRREYLNNIGTGFGLGDFKLLFRLWPLTKTFRGTIFLGLLMIFSASLLSLVLPYLLKIAVDGHILPMGRLWPISEFNLLPKPYVDRLKPEMFIKTFLITQNGEKKPYLILPYDKTKYLDARQERIFSNLGLIESSGYYFKKIKLEDSVLLEGNQPKVKGEVGQEGLTLKEARLLKENIPGALLFDGYLAVSESELAKTPKEILRLLRGDDLKGLWRLVVIYVFICLLGYGLDLGQRYFLETGAQKLGHSLRERVLTHLLGLSQSFFDLQQIGKLTSRLTSDINNVNAVFKSAAASFFSDLLSLAGVVAVMFYLSPRLALATLVMTPTAAIISYFFSQRARVIQRNLREKVATINQAFGETMAGVAIIQAFRREKETSKDFGALNDENYQAGLAQVKNLAMFLPLVDLCATLVLALVLWIGGHALSTNAISLGVLAAFVGYTARFFNPIKDIAEKVNAFQAAFASIERLWELMEINQKIPLAPIPKLPVKPGGRVEFRDVSFSYFPNSPLVLDKVSFVIERGQSTALVGATGSGKSSLISLLLRFYDPTQGSILIDGVDLKELDLEKHRRRIGLVTQEVHLYSATVMDNLTLGRTDLDPKEVIKAAKAVGADQFIERLPLGYNEPLGPSGRGLSSGQKQLVSCARALIEAPEFVVLDEATAFVDSETELLIEKAMKTLFEGRTSVVIAHRFSTIKSCRKVLVLKSGKLVEEGDHDSLMALKGLYYHLANLQG
ncbi:MAG: ABC transporter ATP-binding protein/permease [Deltaproteobacteria bacterium]|jgi:ATP-binding cassette subfamily B protein|nr:ABC transporter ATP-binding protein/permease [Deltaproteobacteria bacterium]